MPSLRPATTELLGTIPYELAYAQECRVRMLVVVLVDSKVRARHRQKHETGSGNQDLRKLATEATHLLRSSSYLDLVVVGMHRRSESYYSTTLPKVRVMHAQ